MGLNSHLQIPLYLQSVQARGLLRLQRLGGQGQGRTADLPLFSWPEQPWSGVAPGPRSQRAYPRSEDGSPLGQPPIRLPQRPAREWRTV